MTLEELQTAHAKDPEAALAAAVDAIATQKALVAEAGREKIAILGNKAKVVTDLHEAREKIAEHERIEADRLAEIEAEAAEGEDDADPSVADALKLQSRKHESARDLEAKRHQVSLEKEVEERVNSENRQAVLQKRIDCRDVEDLLRAACKGREVPDAFEDLANRLAPNFKKEADGSYGLYHPGSDEPLRSSRGAGAMGFEEFVEAAMDGAGSDRWNQGTAHYFKPPKGSPGLTPGKGQARASSDLGAMSLEDKISMIGKPGGLEAFRRTVDAAATKNNAARASGVKQPTG